MAKNVQTAALFSERPSAPPETLLDLVGWARTLLLLGVDRIDATVTRNTLSVLLKYQPDIEKVHAGLVVKDT